jgi:hypothetical protein
MKKLQICLLLDWLYMYCVCIEKEFSRRNYLNDNLTGGAWEGGGGVWGNPLPYPKWSRLPVGFNVFLESQIALLVLL